MHYLFSDDDDTSALTSALVASLPEHAAASPSASASGGVGGGGGVQEAGLKRRGEERTIIVDVGEGGDSVASARSLCESWQVVGAGLESAPRMDGDGEGGEVMMLRVEGVGVEKDNEGREKVGEREREVGENEMRDLLERFDEGMGALRRVVGMQERLRRREEAAGLGRDAAAAASREGAPDRDGPKGIASAKGKEKEAGDELGEG